MKFEDASEAFGAYEGLKAWISCEACKAYREYFQREACLPKFVKHD